jgi:hypothetical protein
MFDKNLKWLVKHIEQAKETIILKFIFCFYFSFDYFVLTENNYFA